MHNFQKRKRYKNEKYLRFIRSKGCVICGHPAVAHHEQVTGRGMGIKSSDYETIPLCEKCHEARHRLGKDTFWQGYDIQKLIIEHLTEYIHWVLIGEKFSVY